MTDTDGMVERCARAIWRETYRHDTLLEWSELRKGQPHHKKTMEAARAALTAIHPGLLDGSMVVVPKSALDWLYGEGPDTDGKWFGEDFSYPRPYWWRAHFRKLIAAAHPNITPSVKGE